ARVLGETEFTVQSVHHQAVGRLGDGLRAVAWAEDGVVEAVEADRHVFLIGVQWHPERDALSDPRPMLLFAELVAGAAGYQRRWTPKRRCGAPAAPPPLPAPPAGTHAGGPSKRAPAPASAASAAPAPDPGRAAPAARACGTRAAVRGRRPDRPASPAAWRGR